MPQFVFILGPSRDWNIVDQTYHMPRMKQTILVWFAYQKPTLFHHTTCRWANVSLTLLLFTPFFWQVSIGERVDDGKEIIMIWMSSININDLCVSS